MMTGVVYASREAMMEARMVGAGGSEVVVEALIDTGFSGFLMLPRGCIDQLGASVCNTAPAYLADGSRLLVEQYQCTVIWDGVERPVVTYCMEGDPLVGMGLLWDHLLTIQATTNGPVSLLPVAP